MLYEVKKAHLIEPKTLIDLDAKVWLGSDTTNGTLVVIDVCPEEATMMAISTNISLHPLGDMERIVKGKLHSYEDYAIAYNQVLYYGEWWDDEFNVWDYDLDLDDDYYGWSGDRYIFNTDLDDSHWVNYNRVPTRDRKKKKLGKKI
jgi:hypothetical protein